jgi:phosphopantetheinyl transferase
MKQKYHKENDKAYLYIQKNSKQLIDAARSKHFFLQLCSKLNLHPELLFSENNKPFFKQESICFNISNAQEVWCCGISNYPIGVDVVYKSDFDLVHNLDPIFNMVTIEEWCAKEAIIKCLDIPLDEIIHIHQIHNSNQYQYHQQKINSTCYWETTEYYCYLASQQASIDCQIIINEL